MGIARYESGLSADFRRLIMTNPCDNDAARLSRFRACFGNPAVGNESAFARNPHHTFIKFARPHGAQILRLEQYLMGCALSLNRYQTKTDALNVVLVCARLLTPYQRHAFVAAGSRSVRTPAFERSGDTFNVKDNVNRLDAHGRDPCRRNERKPRRRV
jgi:hypothetical protein